MKFPKTTAAGAARICEVLELPLDQFLVLRDHGICGNLAYHLKRQDGCYLCIRNTYNSWKHFSGDCRYPIPGGELVYCMAEREKWYGLQLQYRLQLMEHIKQNAHLMISNTDIGWANGTEEYF